MKLNAKFIITCGAVFAAVNGMAYGAWQIGDTLEIRPTLKWEFKLAQDATQQLILSVQWLELENLEKQYASGILSDQDKQKRCNLAYILRAFYVKDCIWPVPQLPLSQ